MITLPNWMRFMVLAVAVTDVPSFSVIRERSYPLLCGAGGLAVALTISPDFFAYADDKGWNISDVYLAGFEFAAVATSFLFTFYTFVITAERGFIARMRRSIHYQQLITYTVRALALGVALALLSLPMMVTDPLP